MNLCLKQGFKELFCLPNIISLSRLLLSLIIPILWIKQISPDFIYILIIYGALSDTLDGNLARIFNLRSNIGKILDPLADKAFINMIFFLFYYEDIISLSFFLVILSRDLLIVCGALYLIFLTKAKLTPSPSLLGKITTVSQLSTLLALFMHHFLHPLPDLLLNIFLNLTLLFTISSGIDYLLSMKRMLSHAQDF